jgi:hypothetical protein
MSKRIILVLLVLVLALAVVGLTAFANRSGKTVEVNQRLAGSIFGGIEVTSGSETVNRSLLNLYATGAPGDANIEVVGGAIPAAEASGLCPEDIHLELTFVDGGFVETFRDQSMLFWVLDESDGAKNALCVYFPPDPRPATGTFDYVVLGGAGRYEGATGSGTVEVTSWGVTQELSAETATFQGTVQLP